MDLTVRAITGSGDSSRDLTRRTEGRNIGKVMDGESKKIRQGRVTEKINCAIPKDKHGLKLIRNNVPA